MPSTRSRSPRASLVASNLVLAIASACSSTSSSASASDVTWLEPSPALRAQIEDAAIRLPWTHGVERIQMIQWFAGVGEPAYGTLLALARDPRLDVAGAALAALGATRDERLVLHLREVPIPAGPEAGDFKLERARTLLRLGDWQPVPDLIDGLRDDRAVTRTLCFQALFESTHEKFDYDPRGEPEAREAAVRRWEVWWEARRTDPLLPGPKRG